MSFELVIIFPAHNEAKRLPTVLEDYVNYFNQSRISHKILVIDNASTDGTANAVEAFNFPAVEVIREEGLGKGRAVKTGFEKAVDLDCEYVGFVDADGSTTAKEFFRLFQVAKNFDGVIASRLLPGSQVYGRSFLRQTVSRLFKLFRNVIIFLPFADTQCGAKIFKKEVVQNVLPELTIHDMAFDVQLLAHMYKNKHFIREEPSIWVHTGNSATFSSPLALMKTAWKMLRSIYKIKK